MNALANRHRLACAVIASAILAAVLPVSGKVTTAIGAPQVTGCGPSSINDPELGICVTPPRGLKRAGNIIHWPQLGFTSSKRGAPRVVKAAIYGLEVTRDLSARAAVSRAATDVLTSTPHRSFVSLRRTSIDGMPALVLYGLGNKGQLIGYETDVVFALRQPSAGANVRGRAVLLVVLSGRRPSKEQLELVSSIRFGPAHSTIPLCSSTVSKRQPQSSRSQSDRVGRHQLRSSDSSIQICREPQWERPG